MVASGLPHLPHLPPRPRVAVLWCPDWPAAAALRESGLPADAAAAVLRSGRVQVTTAAARAEGIRIGMRQRDAQSRYPDLVVLRVDPERDARQFEQVAAAVEEVIPAIEVLRPGLLACRIDRLARYAGSEDAAAELLIDAAEAEGAECRIGIAGSLPVAVLAAHRGVIVPAGPGADTDAAFCATLPIRELTADPAIAPRSWRELADLLILLGIRTAGAFAALPIQSVASRFGADGVDLHRLASGRPERAISRRVIAEDIAVDQPCDPPLQRVDTAAFLARSVAAQFHDRLAAAGLVCTRLAITATLGSGEELHRIWRVVRPLTSADTADRLRWQLDGWLTRRSLDRRIPPQRQGRHVLPWAQGPGLARSRRDGADLSDAEGVDTSVASGYDPSAPDDDIVDHDLHGITSLRLEALEAVDAGRIQYGLWGSDGAAAHRAGSAFARVQGLLGPQAVVTSTRSGGRGVTDRVATASWGEPIGGVRDAAAPWPGSLPSPAPTRARHRPVRLLDQSGRSVQLTDRGMLTGVPEMLEDYRVVAWAGPWPIEEAWWTQAPEASTALAAPAISAAAAAVSAVLTAPRRLARAQVLLDSGPPILLELTGQGWRVEAVYD